MAEILAELFFWGIIFPVLTHTMRHELGHATEYLKQLEPDDEKNASYHTYWKTCNCYTPFEASGESKWHRN